MRIILALGLAALVAAPVVAQEQPSTPDQVVQISGEDREMNEAIAHAQATLDDFLAIARKPPKGAKDFRLKVMFTDEYGVEHMWVNAFSNKGEDFTGTLVNEPETVRSVKAWQKVEFKRGFITDWGYQKDGREYGSFTVCVMLKHMDPEEAKQYRARFPCTADAQRKKGN